MVRQPPQYTLADTLFPSTTLVRSGVARIVIARARPAQRRADFESEAEGIARRGIGAVARTARQPVAETGAAFGAVFGDDPAIIAAHRQPAERQRPRRLDRSAEHTSELPSLMRTSYAVFCLQKKKIYRLYHIR